MFGLNVMKLFLFFLKCALQVGCYGWVWDWLGLALAVCFNLHSYAHWTMGMVKVTLILTVLFLYVL